MSFSANIEKNIVIIRPLVSYLTGKESVSFKEVTENQINAGFNKLVIDFSETEFIDSTFLGSLITFYKKFSSTGGIISLCGISDEIRSLIENTGTIKLFNIYQDINEALASYTC